MHNRTGAQGEKLAADFLLRKGWQILTTNWHCPYGEIDIIARDGAVTVFVEVKTRRTASTEDAFASMTTRKAERLIASAYTWLEQYAAEADMWRIDLIAIALTHPPSLNHVENALDW